MPEPEGQGRGRIMMAFSRRPPQSAASRPSEPVISAYTLAQKAVPRTPHGGQWLLRFCLPCRFCYAPAAGGLRKGQGGQLTTSAIAAVVILCMGPLLRHGTASATLQQCRRGVKKKGEGQGLVKS